MSRKRLKRKIKDLYPKYAFEKDRSRSREKRPTPISLNHPRKEVRWPLIDLDSDFRTLYRVSVATGSRSRATDPKDHIYGLLGMASNIYQLGIIPDYNKSVEDIYREVAGKILEHDFHLLLMSQRSNSQQVPSWVPDWRQDLTESPSNCAGFRKPFRAYGQVQPILPSLRKDDPRDIPAILEVTGIRVDVVSYTGAVFRNDETQTFSPNSRGLLNVHLFLAQIEDLCHRSAALDERIYGGPKIRLKDAPVRISVGDCEKIPPRRRPTWALRNKQIAVRSFYCVLRLD